MTEQSKAKSLIEEARKLLSKATPRPWQESSTITANGDWRCIRGAMDVDNGWVIALIDEQCISASDDEPDANAALLARAPEIISQLCDELDRQVSLNKVQASEIDSLMRNIDTLNAQKQTQAESLSTCHDRMKLQKEAIESVTQHVILEAASLHSALHVSESAAKKFAECQEARCVNSRLIVAQLTNSITPKGETKS